MGSSPSADKRLVSNVVQLALYVEVIQRRRFIWSNQQYFLQFFQPQEPSISEQQQNTILHE